MTKIPTRSSAFDWQSKGLQWPITTDVGPGLSGVIAAETRVSWLDPSSGQLAYRGVPIEVLAAAPDFEAVTYLLVTGRQPDGACADFCSFRGNLRSSRVLPPQVVDLIRSLAPSTHPTRILRAGISALGCHELTAEDDLAGSRQWRELRVVGQVASVVAELCRHRDGRPAMVLDPGESLARGLLRALNDRSPDSAEVRALDLLLVLYAAHGLDAPTFTSMVVASCLADPYANVVAGLCALRGPRTGGAPETVIRQLLEIKTPNDAERWTQRTLDGGRLIAGFGHRTYRMPDPRVVLLRKEAAAAARRRDQTQLFEIARAVEDAATRALAPRGVYININFYGALLFHLLGAPPSVGPCLVAVGRMAGMTALVREALETIRLYRPLSRYVGVDERDVSDGGIERS